MTSDKRLAELTELEGVLDTFGGDPARWPASKRERMTGFAASDTDARRLLREAEALDTVLTDPIHSIAPHTCTHVAMRGST